MSTKNLARTAIEIGRRSTWERNQSHRLERARTRTFLAQAKQDPELWEAADPRPRPRVFREQADKLNPVHRFLRSRVGKPWNDVRSEVVRRFNSNTIAGHHILHDHILLHMVTPWQAIEGRSYGPYPGEFIVDRAGVLTQAPDTGRYRYKRNRVTSKESDDFLYWLLDHRVIESGNEVFWAEPHKFSWEPCSKFFDPNKGEWVYRGYDGGCLATAHQERTNHLEKKQLYHRLPNNWRQGRKFTRKERAVWAQLPDVLKDRARHVSGKELEIRWRKKEAEQKAERKRWNRLFGV